MSGLSERHRYFSRLHEAGCFVIPNPWDLGSARVMAAKGAQALATTSAGMAFTLGRPDMGRVTRDEALAHAEAIVAATPLPVSGDFENGFGDAPADIAETVRLAREVGLSGCSIEDTTMGGGHPPYAFEAAVGRVAAGVDAARGLADPFVLCARADGLMNGTYDLEEALKRVAAFARAGADLVYIPILPDLDAVRRVVSMTGKPVNVLAAGAMATHDVAALAGAGARRISTGSQVARLAHRALVDAMDAMLGEGHFAPFARSIGGREVDRLLDLGAGPNG